MYTVRRKLEIVRQDDGGFVRLNRDRRDRVQRIGYRFDTHPRPGVARHCDAKEPEFEQLLDRAGVEHRHHQVHEGGLTGRRYVTGHHRVIITDDRQNATMRGSAT